jgi:predicted ester cyclase
VDDALTVARRACDAADARDWEAYRDCFDERCVYRSGARGTLDREEAVAADRAMAEAIDARVEREAWVGDDHRAAWRWRITGRHNGEFLGIAPTGNAIDVSGATIASVQHGRITELETFPDRYTLLTQLGVLGTPS